MGEVVLTRVRRELESARNEASRTQIALNDAQAEAAARQAKTDALEEKIMRWRPGTYTEEGVQTSPRILPPAGALFPEGQVWGSEIAALHRSVESLQAMVSVEPSREGVVLPYGSQEMWPSEAAHVSKTASRGGHVQPSSKRAMCIYMERHLLRLHRSMRLRQAWECWLSHKRATEFRAEFDMVVADDHRIAREREAREKVNPQLATSELDELTMATLKQLLLEFRLRLVAAVSDMSPSSSPESRALLVENLDRGRRCFGRIFHAALFLYQKLRAFVPTELHESLHDPLSKLVPFPFYVLPYKAQHALKRGLSALSHGTPGQTRSASPSRGGKPGNQARSASPSRGGKPGKVAAPCHGGTETREEWFGKRIAELEEHLPLASSSRVEVPHFLSRLLQCRALATQGGGDEDDDEEAPMRDRFDVLLADALTIYMSAWRTSGTPESAAQTTLKPHATTSPYLGTTIHTSSAPNFKLRLGAKGRSGM